ncbi:hypothetical protein GQ44DRAFT_558356, partial [Phaeosphaeriaceae sp. PMI808]
RTRDSNYPSVPPHTSLHPGTPVSIILKQDQQSGHQVHGIIADLLTRGSHPRGVKVRLRDGRVGRVQKIVTEREGETGEGIIGGSTAGLWRNEQGGRIEKDIRDEDEYLYDEYRENKKDAGNSGLFSALEEADREFEQSKGGKLNSTSKMVRCPVCGEFEGDERAVEYHVESHF